MKSRFQICRGMALVITLAAVVLITALILAFFSRARINRQISYASLNNIQSDLLARSALDIVIGELREEIRVSSTSQNGGDSTYPRIFKPKTTASLLPQRSGIDDLTSGSSANLVAVSSSGAPLYAIAGSTGRILGSSVAISATSANGRSFPASRWFGDNYGPRLGSQSTLPSWSFVTRNNGIRANPAIGDAKDPSKNDYVIGRFAFTVYDISGLLNANVAGYPSSAATQAGYKSSQAYAVLTELPGFTNASVDALTNWRNSTDAGSDSAYSAYLTDWGKRYGFLQMKRGHNTFFSRHDLLSAASGSIAGIPSSALTDLTTFSRSLIAPDTAPPAVAGSYANSTTDYASQADASASANRNLPNVRFAVSGTVAHYRDDGSTEKYTVTAGAPLVQRRFSLAKLAWLTCRGPSASLTSSDKLYNAGGTPQAIQACFGLTWDPNEERWLYVGSSGNTLQTDIKTLAQVASDAREPNFFELLKAGILVGSLGSNSNQITAMGTAKVYGVPGIKWLQQYYDQKADLQVLRIGANIIDCADPTNYPTRIAISVTYPSLGAKTTEVAGIKDLPYMQTLLTTALRVGTATSSTTTLIQKMDYVWAPMLFNPHRTSTTSATEGPSSLQFSFTSGLLADIQIPVQVAPNTDLSQQPALTINSGQFESFRSKPSTINASSDPNSLGSLVNYATGDKDVLCWLLYSYKDSGKLPGEYLNTVFRADAISNVMIACKYISPGNKWRTYFTFWNSESLAGNNGNFSNDCGLSYASLPDLSYCYYLNHWDPRTNRFGAATGWTRKPSATPPLSVSAPTGCVRTQIPFTYSGSGFGYYLYALWPEGAKKQGDLGDYFCTNFVNNDSLYRPADAWLGQDANPYRDLTNTTSSRRPVILHRAYRSVAELGYVFRDEAWKTLDFFDGSSGDSALLALFSVADEPPVTADLVHLDSRTFLTHQALLSNASQEHSGTAPLTNPQAIASAFNSYAFLSGTPSDAMPLNVSQTADYLMSLNGNSSVGLDNIKYRREAVVRALANNTQTRTWNLLIDVAAQTGRYAPSAQSLDQFVVDGEKRYWLSVAIDRYTGKIVDQQLEPAND